jgi:hypothetical protein
LNRRLVMHRRQPAFLLSFLCACAVALPVAAQQETATLTGTVRDDSGAVGRPVRDSNDFDGDKPRVWKELWARPKRTVTILGTTAFT